MKIYTKTGDKGYTSLVDGKRVSKSELRIEAYGTVDELNAHLGYASDMEANASRRAFLREVQQVLFVMGSRLATEAENPPFALPELVEEDVLALEKAIDEINEKIPALRNFVLPGGHPAVSYAHVLRTVCRRAERTVIRLAEQAPVQEILIRYLNRLSDYFFMLARMLSVETGSEEIPWKPQK